MMYFVLEPAFVLHARPYRETSLLVDFFTQNHGYISVVARSARGMRSRFKGNLVPFSPLLMSCCGKNELMQLSVAESNGTAYFLQGKILFSGIYLNELLLKLLQKFDPYPDLFSYYQTTLNELQNNKHEQQKTLRMFEKKLLSQLGYGLELSKEVTGKVVLPDQQYYYDVTKGLVSCENFAMPSISFQGSHLLAIQANNFDSSEILSAAKQLMRIILNSLLGYRQLESRKLYL